ncbi:hypothetical protein ACFLRC_01230 [Candidatus Altiarchaeota archaeon]
MPQKNVRRGGGRKPGDLGERLGEIEKKHPKKEITLHPIIDMEKTVRRLNEGLEVPRVDSETGEELKDRITSFLISHDDEVILPPPGEVMHHVKMFEAAHIPKKLEKSFLHGAYGSDESKGEKYLYIGMFDEQWREHLRERRDWLIDVARSFMKGGMDPDTDFISPHLEEIMGYAAADNGPQKRHTVGEIADQKLSKEKEA